MKSSSLRPLLAMLVALFASGFPASGWASLISFHIGPPERELVELNTATGAGTVLTAVTPTRDILGLAYDSATATLYGADHVSDSLYIVDQGAGIATLVGAFGVNVGSPGLAYDINHNVLYMTDNGGSNSELYSLNTTTGAATQIGSGFSVGIAGLGYDPNSDTLYGMGADYNLYTLDTTAGSLSLVGGMGIFQGGGLTYDADNDILYATSSSGSLYTLDTATGAATLVGPIGNNNHGALAFTSAVPVPGTAWLLASALVGLLRLRRGHGR